MEGEDPDQCQNPSKIRSDGTIPKKCQHADYPVTLSQRNGCRTSMEYGSRSVVHYLEEGETHMMEEMALQPTTTEEDETAQQAGGQHWGQAQSGSSSGQGSNQGRLVAESRHMGMVGMAGHNLIYYQRGTDALQDPDHTDLMQTGGASSSRPSTAHPSDVTALAEGAAEAPWEYGRQSFPTSSATTSGRGVCQNVTLLHCCSMWRRTSEEMWRVHRKGRQRHVA